MVLMLNRVWYNFSLRRKLILFFCILLIIPVVMLGMFTYNYFIALIQQKSISYNSEIQKLMIEKIDKYFLDINEISLDIAYSSNVQQYLGKKKVYLMNEALKDADLENELEDYLFTKLSEADNIHSISIFANNYSKRVRAYKKLEDIDYNYELFTEEWYPKVKNLDRDKALVGTHFDRQVLGSGQKVISLVRKIYSTNTYSEMGALVINVTLEAMQNLCREILKDEGVKVYIVDSTGYIIYSNNEEDTMLNLLPQVKSKMTDTRGSFNVNIENSRPFVTYDTSSYTGWRVAISMPYTSLVRESNLVRNVIGIVVIFICGFLVFLIMYVTNRITQPIKKLEECMQTAEKSNFQNRFKVDSNDEIGHLGRNFNNLMDKINDLFKQIYMEQGLKREAEINALQAQINPHFLYNTLNTLKWMAVIQKADKMVQVIDDLTVLLQFTAKKTKELINIKDELRALKKYVNIQKFRYYDRFDVEFNIPDEILHCKILKFTLQPIVENAIFHGFEKITCNGLIVISGKRINNDIIITVKDNGVGIDEKRVNEILKSNEKDKYSFNRIGINNVHQRIRLYFGEKYGLTINSKMGEGTEVSVLIPVVDREES